MYFDQGRPVPGHLAVESKQSISRQLRGRLKTIHEHQARLQQRLDSLEGEPETGRAILISAMELLDDLSALHEEVKTPARKVLTKAIFTKLYGDDLGGGPTITHDELTEPFATVIYARMAEAGHEPDSLRQAALAAIQTAEQASHSDAERQEHDLLAWLETRATGRMCTGGGRQAEQLARPEGGLKESVRRPAA